MQTGYALSMKTLMASLDAGEHVIPIALDCRSVRAQLILQPRGLNHLLTKSHERGQRNAYTKWNQTKINTHLHGSLQSHQTMLDRSSGGRKAIRTKPRKAALRQSRQTQTFTSDKHWDIRACAIRHNEFAPQARYHAHKQREIAPARHTSD